MKPNRLPNTVLSARIHLRIGAFLADYAFIGGVFWVIYWFLGRVPASYGGFRAAASSWPSLLAAWLYFAVMESSPLQATAGKLLFRLRVCDYGLERISIGRAILRFLARTLLGVWFLIMLFTNSMQSIHDLLTKTLVLEAKDLSRHKRNRERYRTIRASP